MLHGDTGQPGLADNGRISIIGGVDNDAREGLVALNVDGVEAVDVVAQLADHGVRVHVRKADHYSGNILKPLGLESCVRVSLCHYNTADEVKTFLVAINRIAADA